MLKSLIINMKPNQHSTKTMPLTIYILHVSRYWQRRKCTQLKEVTVHADCFQKCYKAIF